MIYSIQINNFQSHKKTLLNLSPGVNLFIGSSDSGKSVILRAIRWVAENRPLGEEFRSSWGGDTGVSIKLDDGSFITRNKGKARNSYVVDDEEFKAMGTAVPEQIKQLLNLNDINIQNQLDAPFLLSASPGEVAQTLNKLVNLEEIDTSLFNIAKDLRGANQSYAYEKTNRESMEADLKAYEYLDLAEVDLNIITELDKRAMGERSKAGQLLETWQACFQLQAGIDELVPIVALEPEYRAITKKVEEGNYKIVHMGVLKDLMDDIKDTKVELAEATLIAGRDKELESIKSLSDKALGLIKQVTAIQVAIGAINSAQTAYDAVSNSLAALEKEFAEKMPATCPLCGQPIPKVKMLTRGKKPTVYSPNPDFPPDRQGRRDD